MLLSTCIFKASLNGLLVLRSMIHATRIFVEYKTRAIAGYSFEVDSFMTLVKLSLF